MPTRILSNGNVTVWWVTSIADPSAPTPAEILAGINLSAAISWNNFELGSSGSADIDDRSIVDVGNATSRGFPDFGATLDFFRDANSEDSGSIYNQAFALFKTPGLNGFLVVRYGQKLPSAVAAAGDIVSVYKVVTDYVSDDTEGEDSVKFEVSFLPQGVLYEHVLVKTATALTVTPSTATVAVGALQKLAATIDSTVVNGNGETKFVSSNTAFGTVSATGVFKRLSAGSVTVTVTHPGATGSGTATIS